MLRRNKAPNLGLWNGVGGHLEPHETPLEGILREVWEETGYTLPTARFGGLLTWQGYEIPSGGLYIFTAPAPIAEPVSNDEGLLAWKPIEWACSSPEVVSNIHVFLPRVLAGNPPEHYHFEYTDGQISCQQIHPLQPGFLAQVEPYISTVL